MSRRDAIRVLHLVRDSFLVPRHRHLGSTKDIAGRGQYFDDRGISYEILAHGNTADAVADALDSVHIADYSHVVIEKGHYRSVFKRLRWEAPGCQILVRAHNAEIPHRVDYLRACIGLSGRRGVRELSEKLQNIKAYAARDIAAAWYADHVLSISGWDSDHYWRYLRGRRETITVPFFLPRDYLSAIRQYRRKGRSRLCVVIGSTAPGPLVEHDVRLLFRMLRGTDMAGAGETGWRFVVTGRSTDNMPAEAAFRELGIRRRSFDSPYEMLGRARAVLFPSSYGRGFKTKLLEALVCRAFVICTRKLHARLPPPIQRYCVTLDGTGSSSLRAALRQTEGDFPDGNVNTTLQAFAYRELDRVFGIA